MLPSLSPLLSLLLHAYVALRLLPALAPWPAAALLLAGALAATAWLMPLGIGLRWRRRMFRRGASDRLSVLGWFGMGFFSSLLVLTFLRDLLLAGVALADLIAPGLVDLAAWREISGVAVPLAALAITGYGYARARRTAPVVAVDVPIANLPPALDGFRIAQISDIHVGPTIRRPYLERIVAAVNRL
ncbi:MAG: metallophosphoesterase, partial [Burkholderiaceae bacterium]